LKELAGRNLRVLDVPDGCKNDVGLTHYLAAIQPSGSLDLRDWKLSHDGLKNLAGTKDLHSITFWGNRHVPGDAYAELADMESLQSLLLYNTNATDAGLKGFGRLCKLQTLDLSYSSVGDEGLRELANCRELTVLKLENARITDAGLRHLSGLANLRTLILNQSKVTQAGLRRLRTQLPECRIEPTGLEPLPF
jgi:Leucine-rich repeat (LRR) protein